MEKALPVYAQSRTDHEIFAGLSRWLGIEEKFTENKSESEWMEEMWVRSKKLAADRDLDIPDYQVFLEKKWIRLPDDEEFPGWLHGFRKDPEQNKLSTPSGKIELFSEEIEGFDYEDCPGHPCWIDPYEWLGQSDQKYRLHLLSPQPASKLHSQLDQTEHLQLEKVQGKEFVLMHPDAAASRQIGDGDCVRVFNDRGSCLAYVRLEKDMLDEILVLPTGSWFSRLGSKSTEQSGNPNVLTRDKGTSSLAQGPSANTCLVEIEKIE